ncbi:MAG: 3-hydroxybutyryl-CoA dehydratase [Blastocatellia bacterium]|nr:3-hydroxybutyryl-CoA dehydratase [Blastocatellia bacterium]
MKIAPGDTAQLSTTITDRDIQAFAELTGDHNPVHLDDAFASRTRFKRRIAHGMLVASQLSKVIANDLPGQGSVYLSQTLKFVAPVYPGDTVTARVTVLSVREDKPIITLETVCVNQDGQEVITGEAIVLVQPTAET